VFPLNLKPGYGPGLYRYQQCHCLAALPAKMSVFNSPMQTSHSAISNKPRLRTNNTHIRTIKTQKAFFCEQKHMSLRIWIETIIEYWFKHGCSFNFFICSANINIRTTFCSSRRFFVTLVTYPVVRSMCLPLVKPYHLLPHLKYFYRFFQSCWLADLHLILQLWLSSTAFSIKIFVYLKPHPWVSYQF